MTCVTGEGRTVGGASPGSLAPGRPAPGQLVSLVDVGHVAEAEQPPRPEVDVNALGTLPGPLALLGPLELGFLPRVRSARQPGLQSLKPDECLPPDHLEGGPQDLFVKLPDVFDRPVEIGKGVHVTNGGGHSLAILAVHQDELSAPLLTDGLVARGDLARIWTPGRAPFLEGGKLLIDDVIGVRLGLKVGLGRPGIFYKEALELNDQVARFALLRHLGATGQFLHLTRRQAAEHEVLDSRRAVER